MNGDHSAKSSEFTAEEVAGLLEERDSQISDREAGVLRMRYGLTDGRPKTLAEIGRVYGVSSERVRQIQAKTFAKLKQPWPPPPVAPPWLDDTDPEFEEFDFRDLGEP